jgi:hypothetical protein
MATEFKNISGSYDQTVEDSSHQASSKFTTSYSKTVDEGPKPSQTANKSIQGDGDQHAT